MPEPAVTWEVELKFTVESLAALEAALVTLQAAPLGTSDQTDTYFAHPCRNFAETDEAFRLRTVDGEHCLTYKGPVVDRTIKTRREIEIPCGNGTESGGQWRALITSLGFRPVRDVRKQRRRFTLTRSSRQFEICLDEVPPLGLFAEIETLATTADREIARDLVWELARDLGLQAAEPRSYLELLLTHDGAANS